MNTPVRILPLLISLLCITTTTTLGGCGTLFGTEKVDYRKSSKLPPLEVPPDLTQPSVDDRYATPNMKATSNSATFSTYRPENGSQKYGGATREQPTVLPTSDTARLERLGAQRWLAIKAAPEQAWGVVRAFLVDAGYQIKIEDAQNGVLETEWLDGKPRMQESGIRGGLQRLLGALYSTGMRDKFRIRLERGANGGTEVYISHRGMEEVYEGESKDRTIWQPRPSDPELEAEMLQKLLAKFGTNEGKYKAEMTDTATMMRARLVTGADNAGRLLVADPFDRAWRRVGVALDRSGFTIDDRDRSKGTYFVRYVDPGTDTPRDEKGFLSKFMFWKSDSNKVASPKAQYRIRITESGAESAVAVENAAGEIERTPTSTRILSLLFDQLK